MAIRTIPLTSGAKAVVKARYRDLKLYQDDVTELQGVLEDEGATKEAQREATAQVIDLREAYVTDHLVEVKGQKDDAGKPIEWNPEDPERINDLGDLDYCEILRGLTDPAGVSGGTNPPS